MLKQESEAIKTKTTILPRNTSGDTSETLVRSPILVWKVWNVLLVADIMQDFFNDKMKDVRTTSHLVSHAWKEGRVVL